MAELLKGAPVAQSICEDLINRTETLFKREIIPQLAILRVGQRPDDLAYEKSAIKTCHKVGVRVMSLALPEDAGSDMIMEAINGINNDPEIHGCLMLRPLPDKDAERLACENLLASKDVDCMGDMALSNIFTGQGEGYPPCTAEACIAILKHYGYELTGKKVTVVGRSLVIGKPVAMMLLNENATVSIAHTRTKDLGALCRDAEIIIACAGKAGMIGESFVSPGQIIIDVGINVNSEGKLCGDVDFDAVEPVVSAITPVPGGVGAVTTAILAAHVVDACERANNG